MKKATATYDGIDQLRFAVKLFANCNETFNQRFTAEELLTLWRMYRECGWDIPPDDWKHRQICEALDRNRVPTWRETPTRDIVPSYSTVGNTYLLHTVDGEKVPVTAEQFFADNAADEELRAAITELDVGECHEDGGGAAPEWSIERLT
jgi:hypothetical protein